MSRAKPEIVLACLPWAAATRPSLGIGLLVAAAKRCGFPCRAEYLHLDFATGFGAATYEHFATTDELFALGEHLFAVDLFGTRSLRSDEFLDRFLALYEEGRAGRGLTLGAEALYAVRDVMVPDALHRYTERILAARPDIVGLSCVFNQVLPSLALARRLKQARPGITVLLGGACVHGRMGETYAGAFPEWVDHVFTGEADLSFPALLDAIANGTDTGAIAGVTAGGRLASPGTPVAVLDQLPIPDYDDYFRDRAELIRSGAKLLDRTSMSFESSRGCWWGQKSHCTFCGLNNEGMTYRMKSADRVVSEVAELATRYRCLDFEAADNILPHTAYRSLLPQLANLGLDLRFLYEIKANISRDDAAALRDAGVRWVQPGVESFSDHVLELMRKGSTGAQNIQLLKWLQEHGITPFYNLLVGFPGETDADYEEVIALLPSLFHLTPPVRSRTIMVSVHRFAPFFDDAERWGIQNARPAWYYRHLIPPRRASARDFAFFFDRDVPADASVHRQRARLDRVLARWERSRITLKASLGPGFISVLRADQSKEVEVACLREDAASVFLLCDAQTTPAKLSRDLAALRPGTVDGLNGIVADLVKRRLVARCGDRLVGVVPFDRPHSSAALSAWLTRWNAAPSGPAGPVLRRVHLSGRAMP